MTDYIHSGSTIAPLPALKCGQNARVDELNERIYSHTLAPYIALGTRNPVYGLASSHTKYSVFGNNTVLPDLLPGTVRAEPNIPRFYTEVAVEDQLRHTALASRNNQRAFVPGSDSQLYNAFVPASLGAGVNPYQYLIPANSFLPNARVPNSLRSLQIDSRDTAFGIHTRTILRGTDA